MHYTPKNSLYHGPTETNIWVFSLLKEICFDWSGVRSKPTTECCDIAAGAAPAPVPARVPAEHRGAEATGHGLSAGGSV